MKVVTKNGEWIELTVKEFNLRSKMNKHGQPADNTCETPEKLEKWRRLLRRSEIERKQSGEVFPGEKLTQEKKESAFVAKNPDKEAEEPVGPEFMKMKRKCVNCGIKFHPLKDTEKPFVCEKCAKEIEAEVDSDDDSFEGFEDDTLETQGNDIPEEQKEVENEESTK